MKRLFAAALLALALAGCYSTDYGPELTEPGKVVDLLYVPSGHGTGTGVGVGGRGSVVVTTTSVTIPARYGIVFECQHGRFAVEDQEELWKHLKVGEAVTIHYAEIIRTDNKTKAQEVIGLHFITAVPQ